MPSTDSTSASASNEVAEENNANNGLQASLIAGHNIWEWIFLLVSTWNVALLLASSGIALAQCEMRHNILSPEFTAEVIVIATALLALAFGIYGVHEEHQYDIFLHQVFISVADLFGYLAAYKSCHPCFKFICVFVSIGMTLFNFFTTHKATTASDWTEFRIVGASASLASMYKKQCAFLSLLKLDSLLVIIFAVYTFPITLEFPNKTNLYLLIILICMYSFMSWCCGKVTVCKEDKYLASGFVVLCITYPCLIIYQIYMSNHKPVVDSFVFRQSALNIGLFSIACKLLLAYSMVLTCKTFGYGLNSRSLDILRKFLDRPNKNKASKDNVTWLNFIKECCHLKCSSKAKELEFTYKDIYRF